MARPKGTATVRGSADLAENHKKAGMSPDTAAFPSLPSPQSTKDGRRSLSGRLGLRPRLIFLLGVAMLPLTALVGFLLWIDHDQTMERARARVHDAARLAASSQSSVFAEARATLEALRAVPAVRTPESFAACSAIVAVVKAENPQFNTVGVFDGTGMVTCHDRLKKSQQFGDAALLSRALEPDAPDFLVGNFIIGKASGKPTMVTAMPLPMVDGKPAGAVFASLDLERLSAASRRISNDGARVVVMMEPATSRMLTRYPPLPVPYGTAYPDHPLPRAMRAAPAGGVVETKGPDGVDRIYGFAPVEGTGGSGIMLAVGETRDPLMAPVRLRLAISLAFLGAVLLIASLATWWLGYWTHLRPIDRLMRTAERIGTGDHAAKAELESWQAPEFRTFERRLEEMGGRLAEGRRAELAIAENHRLLTIAERLAHVGYWQLDLTTMRSTWSDEVFRIYGMPVSDAPPSVDAILGTYHRDQRAIVEEAFRKAIDEGAEFEIQLRLLRGSGEMRHVLSRGCTEKNADGKVVLVYGAFLDITEVKRAEIEAQSANTMLLMAEEVSEVGHWRLDLLSGALSWSDQIFRMHGREPGCYVPRLETAIEAYHPDDRDEVSRIVAEAIADKASFELHKRLLLDDGNVRHVISRGRCELDAASGEVVAIFGVIMDVSAQRVAEDRLRESEIRYRMLVENASDMIFRLDRNLVRTYVSPASKEILGYAPEELVGKIPVNMVHEDDAAAVAGVYAEVLGGLERAEITNRIRHRDGHWVWVEVELRALRDPASDQVIAILGALRDVSERKHAEERVASSEARFRMLSENAADLVTHVDATGQRVFASPASLDLLGYRPEELIGGRPIDLAYPEDRPVLDGMLSELRDGRPAGPVQYRARRKNGEYRWIEAGGRPLGADKGYILALRDIDRRKQVEEELGMAVLRLDALANSDGLTGLANRRRFDGTLEKELARGARNGTPVSLLLADVDHFKAFNDTYGHPAGDSCLRQVAGILAGVIRRPGDVAARYGGEEFAAILPDTDTAGALAVAEGFRAAVEAAAKAHDGSRHGVVTISIGVAAIVPTAGATLASDLIEAADGALYAAKASGRNCVRLHRARDGDAALAS